MVIVVKMVAGTAPMDSIKKVTISWSGGKDAAFALYKIIQSKQYEVVHLHTVIDVETKRVGMHGVHETLVHRQAQAMGLPLEKLYLEKSENNAKYAQMMTAFYERCAKEGINAVVFGDIFLEDLRSYRNTLLTPFDLEGIYPLWRLDTKKLISDFVSTGFKTLICSANVDFFSKSEVGKDIDSEFSNRISPLIDPCGERGEFHTFVYEAPMFTNAIEVRRGKVEKKQYVFDKQKEDGSVERMQSAFWFQELLPLMAL